MKNKMFVAGMFCIALEFGMVLSGCAPYQRTSYKNEVNDE